MLTSILTGPLAAGVLAAVTGARVGLRRPVILAMLGLGLLGVALRVIGVLNDVPLGSRLLANILGGLCYLAVSRPLRSGLRAFLLAGGKTRSIWRDGVWIALGCAVAETAAVVALT